MSRIIQTVRDPFLKDYYQIGYEVEVRLDKEEMQRRQARKEQEEKQMQNSWWNQ